MSAAPMLPGARYDTGGVPELSAAERGVNLTLNVDVEKAQDVMALVASAKALGRDVRSALPGLGGA